MKILTFLVAIIIAFCSCDATIGKTRALGSKHEITLYSGGQLINTWTSTGKPLSEASSDGYYFTDAKTGKLIEVSGTIIIEQL